MGGVSHNADCFQGQAPPISTSDVPHCIHYECPGKMGVSHFCISPHLLLNIIIVFIFTFYKPAEILAGRKMPFDYRLTGKSILCQSNETVSNVTINFPTHPHVRQDVTQKIK